MYTYASMFEVGSFYFYCKGCMFICLSHYYIMSTYAGLLNSIFNQIYDCEIAGEEQFRRWKDKGTESYGKGAAVATVKNFFDWLDSCETESDNDT